MPSFSPILDLSHVGPESGSWSPWFPPDHQYIVNVIEEFWQFTLFSFSSSQHFGLSSITLNNRLKLLHIGQHAETNKQTEKQQNIMGLSTDKFSLKKSRIFWLVGFIAGASWVDGGPLGARWLGGRGWGQWHTTVPGAPKRGSWYSSGGAVKQVGTDYSRSAPGVPVKTSVQQCTAVQGHCFYPSGGRDDHMLLWHALVLMLLDDETFVLKLLFLWMVPCIMLWLWYSLLVGGWCSWWVASVLVPHQQLHHLHPHRWLHGSHLLGFIRLCFWVGSISVPSSSWDRSPFLASHCTPHTSAMCSICTMHKSTHQQFISVPESWDTVFGDVCCALQCIWKTLRCSAQHNWIGRVHPLVCGKMKRLVEMCSGWICVTGQWWSELGIIPTYSLDLVRWWIVCLSVLIFVCIIVIIWTICMDAVARQK